MYMLLFFGCQNEMQNFTAVIINKINEEKLLASQGGPIILAQVYITDQELLILTLIVTIIEFINLIYFL